jgi:hypothetical protein
MKEPEFEFRYYSGVGYGLLNSCLNCNHISGMMYKLCLKRVPPIGKYCGGNSVCDHWEKEAGNHE